jgi:hypothetical protein
MQIGIHHHRQVARGMSKPCGDRIMLSEIARKTDAAQSRVTRRQRADDLPVVTGRMFVNHDELVVRIFQCNPTRRDEHKLTGARTRAQHQKHRSQPASWQACVWSGRHGGGAQEYFPAPGEWPERHAVGIPRPHFAFRWKFEQVCQNSPSPTTPPATTASS